MGIINCKPREKDNTLIKSLQIDGKELVYAQFSPDGKAVVTIDKANCLRIWDIRDEKNVEPINKKPFEVRGQNPNIPNIALSCMSPDGHQITLAWISENKRTIKFIELNKNQTNYIGKPFSPSPDFRYQSLAFSPDGRMLALVAPTDDKVVLLRLEGKYFFKIIKTIQFRPDYYYYGSSAQKYKLVYVVFSHDSRFLIAVTQSEIKRPQQKIISTPLTHGYWNLESREYKRLNSLEPLRRTHTYCLSTPSQSEPNIFIVIASEKYRNAPQQFDIHIILPSYQKNKLYSTDKNTFRTLTVRGSKVFFITNDGNLRIIDISQYVIKYLQTRGAEQAKKDQLERKKYITEHYHDTIKLSNKRLPMPFRKYWK